MLFEMKLNKIEEEWGDENQNYLQGLENFQMEIRENVGFEDGTMFRVHGGEYIELTNFSSGSVIGFKIRPKEEAANAFEQIHREIGTEKWEIPRKNGKND